MTKEINPESIDQPESQKDEIDHSIDSLPEKLGFVEIGKFVEKRDQLVAAMLQENNEELVRQLITEYHVLAGELVDSHDDASRPRAQIALIIHVSLIYRDGKWYGDYLENLYDAMDYASNMGYDDITEMINLEIS